MARLFSPGCQLQSHACSWGWGKSCVALLGQWPVPRLYSDTRFNIKTKTAVAAL